MSREIKFRIWDKANKKYMALGATGLDAKNGDVIDYYNEGNRLGGPEEYDVEQYTGLKDKNGKEIYEGDICRLRYSEKRGGRKRWKKGYEDIELVEFENGYFKFSHTDQYGIDSELSFSDYGECGEWSTAGGQYKYEAMVIGNIHENGDLLKGE